MVLIGTSKTCPNISGVHEAERGLKVEKLTELGLKDIEIIDVKP